MKSRRAWVAPSRKGTKTQVENLCYGGSTESDQTPWVARACYAALSWWSVRMIAMADQASTVLVARRRSAAASGFRSHARPRPSSASWMRRRSSVASGRNGRRHVGPGNRPSSHRAAFIR